MFDVLCTELKPLDNQGVWSIKVKIIEVGLCYQTMPQSNYRTYLVIPIQFYTHHNSQCCEAAFEHFRLFHQ